MKSIDYFLTSLYYRVVTFKKNVDKLDFTDDDVYAEALNELKYNDYSQDEIDNILFAIKYVRGEISYEKSVLTETIDEAKKKEPKVKEPVKGPSTEAGTERYYYKDDKGDMHLVTKGYAEKKNFTPVLTKKEVETNVLKGTDVFIQDDEPDKKETKPIKIGSTHNPKANVLYEKKDKTLKKDIVPQKSEVYKQPIDPDNNKYIKAIKSGEIPQVDLVPGAKPIAFSKDERDKIFGKPPKMPEKYIDLIERMCNTKTDGFKPPITSLISSAGAGQISSQFGEVLAMVSATLNDTQYELFESKILEQYNNTKYSKMSAKEQLAQKVKPVLNMDWVDAAKYTRKILRKKYDLLYGPDNWSIDAACWDVSEEANALGFNDYKKNKGFSTDMTIRIKDKKGNVIADEVSLKQSTNVFLYNGAVGDSRNIRMSGLVLTDPKNPDVIKWEKYRKAADALLVNGAQPTKAEDFLTYKTYMSAMKTIESKFDFPEHIDPEKIAGKIVGNAKNLLSDANKYKDDIIKGLSKYSKDLKLSKNEIDGIKFLVSNPTTEENIKKAANIFKPGKGGMGKYQAKLAYTLALIGQDNKKLKAFSDGQVKIQKDFEKHFVESIITDKSLKVGMLNKIRTVLPIKSLMDGEESMALGGFSLDKHTIHKLFGTSNYNEFQEKLSVETDDKGNSYLVYSGGNGSDTFRIADLQARFKGKGYETVAGFEVKLANEFSHQIFKSNVEQYKNIELSYNEWANQEKIAKEEIAKAKKSGNKQALASAEKTLEFIKSNFTSKSNEIARIANIRQKATFVNPFTGKTIKLDGALTHDNPKVRAAAKAYFEKLIKNDKENV